MMIKANSWHYKLYVFNLQLMKKFNGANDVHIFPDHRTHHVGLCSYLRTILVWGPMLYLVYIALAMLFAFAIIGYPIIMTNGVSLIWAVIVAIVIAGYMYIYKHAAYSGTSKAIAKKQQKHHPGFGMLIWKWTITYKTKMCPIVEITNDEECKGASNEKTIS